MNGISWNQFSRLAPLSLFDEVNRSPKAKVGRVTLDVVEPYIAKLSDADKKKAEPLLKELRQLASKQAVAAGNGAPANGSVVSINAGFAPQSVNVDLSQVVSNTCLSVPAVKKTGAPIFPSLQFTRDGSQFIASLADAAYLCDAQTGLPSKTFSASSNVLAVALSPDGTTLVTTHADSKARFWDVATGGLLPMELDLNGSRIPTAVGFSPDGSRISVTFWEGRTRVYDALTQRLIETSNESNPVFSPNGVMMAASKTNGIVVRDAQTKMPLFTGALAKGHDPVVAFSSDAKYVAGSCRIDGSLRVFDVERGCLVAERERSSVSHIAFHPNGKTIVFAERSPGLPGSPPRQSSVLLWDLSNDDVTELPLQTEGQLASLAMSADGTQLIAATTGGQVTHVRFAVV